MKQPVYAPGTIVAGKYRIDKAIARGGCSIVYRGTHIEMERVVALKIMSSGGGTLDRAWTKRFQREARLASQLRHPNTIIIYDYGHDKGLWYITMEWVEGASLRNVIRDKGAIEPLRVAKLTVQILKSLAEAHRQHILHRDLKPSNIMLTRDIDGEEMVKVLDFGLAKADPQEWQGHDVRLTRDGDFVGTPRYASPEQLRGQELTRASDIYGVGMIMWEMLTGQPAVPGVEYALCIEHHLGPRPWQLPPGVYPPGLAMIIEKALQKDARMRFQGCEEMLEPLLRWIKDGGRAPRVNIFEEDDYFGENDSMLGNSAEIFAEVDRTMEELPPLELSGRVDVNNLSGHPESPHAPQQPEARPHRPRQDSQPGAGRSFADVAAGELELDRRATAQPRAEVPARRLGEPDEERSAVKLIGGLALMVGVFILGGVVFTFLQGDATDVGAADEAGDARGEEDPFITQLREKSANKPDEAVKKPSSSDELAEAMATRDPADILVLLRHDGWKFVQAPEKTELDGVEQTSVRIRRRRSTIDLIFYKTRDLQLAKELEFQVTDSTRSARFGFTVVKMTPVDKLSEVGLSELRRRFLELKGLARD